MTVSDVVVGGDVGGVGVVLLLLVVVLLVVKFCSCCTL